MDKDFSKLYKFAVIEKIDVPEGVEKENRSGEYISWGESNLYPNEIYDLYRECSIFTSIIASMKDYTVGDGIEILDQAWATKVNKKGDTLADIITKCIVDRCIFGGFAIQIIRNQLKEIAELYWLDMRYVRINEDEDKIYYNKRWDKGKRNVVTYPIYSTTNADPSSVYYYKGQNSRGVYPVADWVGALKSLKVLAEIDEYNLNNIANNFTPNVIVNFNNGSNIPDDVADELETRLYDKFSGTRCAGRYFISFNDDKDHATELVRLPDDGLENKYQLLKETTSKNVYSAFRINPCLLGYNADHDGFNNQEFDSAFKLYNKTVIQPIQAEMVDAVEKLIGKNTIQFKPFTIDFDIEKNNTPNIIS